MIEFLKKYALEKNVSFHMPGHKGSGIFKKYGFADVLNNIVDADITEIVGADNLYHPEGIIRDIQDGYAELYGSKKSFILINGTTAGVLASIMATVGQDRKILMSRGCHKSVHNGIKLAKAEPIYVMPRVEKELGVMGQVKASDIEIELSKHGDIDVVILPSPNYYGICSDIKAIADVVHKYGKLLIVDQAHGAHLKLFEKFGNSKYSRNNENIINFPKSAESLGADIVINSTHKTLASFTQSAVLNIMSDRADVDKIFRMLQLVQSSSPSYLLMLSLAMNLEIIRKDGNKIFENWRKDIEYFYEKARDITGMKLLDTDSLDRTKLTFSFKNRSIKGKEIEEYLIEKGIYIELVTEDIVMGISGIGNKRYDYDRLLSALKELDDIGMCNRFQFEDDKNECECKEAVGLIPPLAKFVGEKGSTEKISLADAQNRISANIIAPYPPGIPFLCSGELITKECVDELVKLRENKKLIYGISEDNTIDVYKN